MSHDVFISYSSEDKSVADAVVAALENKGIRCWYAPRDIEAGTDWGESITRAIGDSTLMLLIFSKNSNQSKRVLDEIYVSISEEKTILPFRIENLDPSGAMRLHLSSRHWLDAYSPSWEAHINKLVDTVASNLKVELKLSDNLSLHPAPSKEPKQKGLPWKLIGGILAVGSILAVCLVIVIVIGIMNLQRNGTGDQLPTATEEIGIPESALPSEAFEIPPAMLTTTPKITQTVAHTSGLDLSQAVLKLEDLPPGFEEVSLAELGLTAEDLSGDGFTVESIFAFMGTGTGSVEFVMGYTMLLPTQIDQTGFDIGLGQPEFLMASIIEGMGATDILEQNILTDLDDIGNTSTGLTVVADIEGIPMRMDMAAFRRDAAGAFIIVMYVDGTVPFFTVDKAASKLDARIIEILPDMP